MKRSILKKWLVLEVVALALIVVGSFSFTNTSEAPASDGYTIGDAATDFNLKNVDGKMVSLSHYKDAKGFIVIFTCNTCPYAVASEDRIIALDKEFKSKGFPVIAINPNNPEVQPDDTFEKMQQKVNEKGFTFPYLYDDSSSIYAEYGAKKTPHVYLLQKEKGKNIVKYIGAIDDNVRNGAAVKDRFLANAVNELLQGKEVTVKETKAIGCSIKV
ncbi:thioredoxin family protein [Aureisphaera sp. CAU 1614]|uniref:Thioredoxin family protein n=1 Tax=Halomarinibacterium sedimenti TaxID=2857106 RepID=A0A9X1FQT2_9FLAO|nr:thioredoxin family protein [Halomarinibacterium sedimenti]MBW2938931.1 thioredoxin family protein [Halomarinibacterium sedimenti]